MPNNLVFNNSPSQLLTQIYGDNGGLPIAISVDGTGNLSTRQLSGATDSVAISGTVTVTATDLDIRALSSTTDSVTVEGTVTIGNTVTVTTGTVTVTATDLDIRALSSATDSVTVEGTVTIGNTVTVTTGTVTVITGGTAFTETNYAFNNVTGTASITAQDTSQQGMYSFFIRNTGTSAVSVKLQISPTNDPDYFIDDSSVEISVAAGEKGILVPLKFLKYTTVVYNAPTAATFEIYYNAHV